MVEELKIGDLVKWCDSTYFIVDIVEGGAILKQNFSISTTLISPIPLGDITFIKSF
tara:strand:+ start:145 stop:312 length:168 start_codon:yes stop_codon:yes gene_type:complete